MKLKKAHSYDVFLSHSSADAVVANSIRRELEANDLAVFATSDMPAGDEYNRTTRIALWESLAFVVVLTRSHMRSGNLAFELGAALGANIPIFIVSDGVQAAEVPAYLSQYQLFPLDSFPQVLQAIRNLQRPLTNAERDALVAAYQQIGMPVDQLIGNAAASHDLADDFARATGNQRDATDLIRALLQLRKQGKLPRRGLSKTSQS